MGTRSRIGIQLADESILSVYCHYDGYPEFNGVKLVEHFNSRDAVTELIDGGDISALWTNAGWNNETLPETGPLYYSSRGEDCPPRFDADLCEYLLPDGCEEYHYIFRNGEWVCYDMHQFDNTKLSEIVEIPVPVAA
jgi:hypothetical protein